MRLHRHGWWQAITIIWEITRSVLRRRWQLQRKSMRLLIFRKTKNWRMHFLCLNRFFRRVMPLLICLRNISENFDIGVEKTESDLDNRTGRLQRMLHSPVFSWSYPKTSDGSSGRCRVLDGKQLRPDFHSVHRRYGHRLLRESPHRPIHSLHKGRG